MPDTPSITLVKSFDYRGLPEEWSNTYHFTGGPTLDNDTTWRDLAVSIWNEERTVMTTRTKLVRAYGYEAGNDHSVSQIEFTGMAENDLNGTNDAEGAIMAGDQAAMIRARVGSSSTGKKVYIRKYYHDVPLVGAGGDRIHPNAMPELESLAQRLIDGNVGDEWRWCGPQGAAATNAFASPWVTTRTLKRRGKRPTGP